MNRIPTPRAWCLSAALAAGLLPCAPADATEGEGGPSQWLPPSIRVDEFAGWFHDAGNVLLHVSNRGYFGRRGSDLTAPSGEWPAGTNQEYLYGAGLWVAGVINRSGAQDTLCSSGLFQQGEFANVEQNEGCGSPPEGICQTFEGAPAGLRRFDDDGDGLVDEDALDGEDNDGDGRIDEDFAGISQQMFRCVFYDTSTAFNQFFPDDADQHVPMGLKVTQESYVWTDPQFDDFVGVEYSVLNMSNVVDPAGVGWDINNAYVGFMVDGDVGIDDEELNNYEDDHGAFAELDTTVVLETGGVDELHITLGYIFDNPGTQGDDVPGYCGVMFLGHTVDTLAPDFESSFAPREVGLHTFRIWSSGDEDDRDDLDRYRFLRGSLGDTVRSISPPTFRENDYRFLVSAGPFKKIPPGSTLVFQVAFVCGLMVDQTDVDGNTRRVAEMANPVQAQRVYNGFVDPTTGERVHWATSSPPPPPNINVTAGDRHVVVEWDDFPEEIPDPLTRQLDFAGYQVWKAEGWKRESNIPSEEMWRLIADFDSTELSDIDTGMSGLGKYRYVDTRVQNGFFYWYAVSAYDRGTISLVISGSPPETTVVRSDPPKFGKFSQNMVRVMPRTTPAQTLDDVYVVPNPYRGSAAWDLAETSFEPTGRRIKFFNLPERATIRIFTLAGDHVVTLEHDDRITDEDRGQASWNLVSKNNQDTVSGIYLYHVTDAATGQEKVGKFVIIR
ncbi:MAG: hypothetical protein ACT4PE_11050 [Candidatus Eiseniibacteriota bacterium]